MSNKTLISVCDGTILRISTDNYGAMVEVFKSPLFDNDGCEMSPPNYVMFQVRRGEELSSFVTAVEKRQP